METLSELPASKIETTDSNFPCPVCCKTYSRKRSLKKHLRISHDSNAVKFVCSYCHKTFAFKDKLKRHIELIHMKKQHQLQCPLCGLSDVKAVIMHHFESFHNINIERDEFSFISNQEFLDWKESYEKATYTKFASVRSYCTKNGKKTFFECHRNGFYKPKGMNKRHLKSQGTNKIMAYCPSGIDLTVDNCGYHVKFLMTHVGHDFDLKRLTLSRLDKKEIEDKINMKIPFNVILEEIQDSKKTSESKRIHLLTRQDLRNIEKKCKVSGEEVIAKHEELPDDNICISIQTWNQDYCPLPESNQAQFVQPSEVNIEPLSSPVPSHEETYFDLEKTKCFIRKEIENEVISILETEEQCSELYNHIPNLRNMLETIKLKSTLRPFLTLPQNSHQNFNITANCIEYSDQP